MSEQPCAVAIMGPTASGKSKLASLLAREFDAEIISADSAQVYRQVNIGTAKPAEEELSSIPHHLINIRDLGEGFSLAEFQELAKLAVNDIWKRGHLPLIVGGTCLYIRGLFEGYTLSAPAPDMELRESVNSRDLSSLLEELKRLDPATYEDIDRCNKRRVARALEVVIQTGKSFKECSRREPPPWKMLKLGINIPRERLRENIVKRMRGMIEAGWIDEVRHLLEAGWKSSLIKANILGYDQVINFVEEKSTLSEMEEAISIETCRFAKRQCTWMRSEPNLQTIESNCEGIEVYRRVITEFLNARR